MSDGEDDQAQLSLNDFSIPPQPDVIDKIREAYPNVGEVSRLIHLDPGLASATLKVVNSAAFSLKQSISSINHAVMLLGLERIMSLVNIAALKEALGCPKKLMTFWDHANDIAVSCAVIAEETKFLTTEEAYTLGLFHNTGILILGNKFDDYLDIVHECYKHEVVTELEDKRYRTNHTVIGYYLAKTWKLPEFLCLAIRDHHDMPHIMKHSEEEAHALAILKLSEHICKEYKTLGEADIDPEWPQIEAVVLDHLHLSEFDYEEICYKVKDRLIQ
ncbi:HDOD domain-containing protein [Piscirickettsia litoralis]|uniref:HDOD domain-containing protein n=1 Tax=Piscirickettsia litoralis TaxID=1891921 RepID=A0ABX3A530_9GAMM|nr:HDOD domain-containing protein [Piscirickettsia litoralis]ODN42535.1 hypothetical protein BGC07_05830 [Piscirickettsia litoralis]